MMKTFKTNTCFIV